MPLSTRELLRRLPKAELHCHLDGSVRPQTMLDLGAELGRPMPAVDAESLRAYMRVDDARNLEDYLERFAITLSVMQTDAALERIAFELAEDSARDGVRYIEVRYAPVLNVREGLSLEQAVEAPLRGLGRAEEAFGIKGRVIVDAKTGSSGSGAKAAANTHHPQRMNSFYAYKPFVHQHVPEIEQELAKVGDWTSELVFMTHSLPVSRGIFSSIYVEAKQRLTEEQLHSMFTEFYRDSFFVRLVQGSPDINWVKTTNFCDLGFAVRGQQVVIFSAIDNLVKGAAGQAVQNMNLMFGLDEKTGLMLVGTNP